MFKNFITRSWLRKFSFNMKLSLLMSKKSLSAQFQKLKFISGSNQAHFEFTYKPSIKLSYQFKLLAFKINSHWNHKLTYLKFSLSDIFCPGNFYPYFLSNVRGKFLFGLFETVTRRRFEFQNHHKEESNHVYLIELD